jgi:hypothetical protein
MFEMKKVELEGHGVLIVARDTVSDSMPLCLALGETGNKLALLPCFQEWVPPTLAQGWETGAVVLRETAFHTRWEVGPCTTDGHVERLYVTQSWLLHAPRSEPSCFAVSNVHARFFDLQRFRGHECDTG